MTPEQRVSDKWLAMTIDMGRVIAVTKEGQPDDPEATKILQMMLDEHYDAMLDLRDCRAALRFTQKQLEAASMLAMSGPAWTCSSCSAAESLLAEAERMLLRTLAVHVARPGPGCDCTLCALLAKLKAHRETMGAASDEGQARSGDRPSGVLPGSISDESGAALTVTRDELRALALACVVSSWSPGDHSHQDVADRVLSRWLAERGER